MNHLKISDEKAKERTGKSWKEWFEILDEIKAKNIGDTQTAKKLVQD